MATYLETIDITYQQVMDRIKQANGQSGDAAAVMFRDLLKRELQNEISSLEVVLADVYASEFSADELVQLKAFFITPVGQKLIGSTTSIAQNFAAKSTDFQQKMALLLCQKSKWNSK